MLNHALCLTQLPGVFGLERESRCKPSPTGVLHPDRRVVPGFRGLVTATSENVSIYIEMSKVPDYNLQLLFTP
ncbi:hypothetical protein VTJ04DRAFT_2210 [Mycothermus thermophilus]|uniref:uncharacterized protein n=1 Tax=Humicola insolens TaxID=85995 RepID=UPI003743D007